MKYSGLRPGLIFILLCLTTATASAETTPPRPNILIIFTDDQGYADFGCFGAETNETPRRDQFA